jgi:hypothetical protein
MRHYRQIILLFFLSSIVKVSSTHRQSSTIVNRQQSSIVNNRQSSTGVQEIGHVLKSGQCPKKWTVSRKLDSVQEIGQYGVQKIGHV